MILSRSLFSLLLCVALLCASSADVRGEHDALSADSRAQVLKRLEKTQGRRGTAACVVLDLDTGATLFNSRGDQPLIPASNMKLVVTAAGLKLLGGDFEFKTQLLADTAVAAGALPGALYVLGGGDPNISGRFYEGDSLAPFKGWAAELKKAGITRIDGGIRYDSSMFGTSGDEYCEGWPDDQYTRWYCAEVSALAFNDNCVGIRVTPTRPGMPANIEVVPATGYVRVVNETKTAAGRKAAEIGIVRPRDGNTITVKGTVYAQASWGYFVDVAVHDPACYAATVLRETLQREGIAVNGTIEPCVITVNDLKRCRVLLEHRSPLLRALGPINTNSQNLHAEMLFRHLGLRYTGKGTFRTSRAALQEFLREQGWWQQSLSLVDGSGLARDNRVTAELLVRLLRAMAGDPNFSAFRDSLAVAGESGTLQKRLKDKELRGTVYAKTGYIRGVHALSGYLLSGRRRLAFSMLMNDCVNAKEAQDQVLAILARAAN